jgi:hypothetical protein
LFASDFLGCRLGTSRSYMRAKLKILTLILTFCFSIDAQYNSGSTGADGALDLTQLTCPNNICRVQLPESGVLNYTTINIPSGKELQFKSNSRNTPVILLAQGDVLIGGGIQLSAPGLITNPVAAGNIPGPGGFYGAGVANSPGFGPGGGNSTQQNGIWRGPLSLVPIVGGSGGASFGSGRGGGGGGAITIASSTQIVIAVSGAITAWGGIANPSFASGSCGSGGAIRLVATSLNIAGQLKATSYFCGPDHNGVIRLESNTLEYTGSANPLATQAAINPSVASPTAPILSIASIGGFSVPSNAGTRLDLIDILLPTSLADPVNVTINAQNIPTGTTVQIGFLSGSPSGSSNPCSLSGSLASSSCTATVSNLNRTGGTYLLATAAFTPPGGVGRYNPKGRDHVAKIKLEAQLGAKARFTFLRADGTVVDPKVISKQFLQEFGM